MYTILTSILLLPLQGNLSFAKKLNVKNLVTFGDSYTNLEEPAGFPGDTPWPVYAAGYGNYSLTGFAHVGATCSNTLTSLDGFPTLLENELPEYLNATNNGTTLDPEETMYTLWIGTNDVGAGALISGQGMPGVSIVDTSACAVNFIKKLYDSGARNFLFQNMIPLDHTKLYSVNSYNTLYWTSQRNTTEWNVIMKELVAAGNSITRLMLSDLASTLCDAHIGLFDSHALFTDILNNPTDYLNGTGPINTTDASHACVYAPGEPSTDPGNCTDVMGTDRDNYLWWDELHPSEQGFRIVAREVVSAINGSSQRWTTWFS